MTGPRSARDIDRVIGERLFKLRRQRGLSQEAVGESVGVSWQQIAKYETGRNRISAGRVYELALAFGVPVSLFYPRPDRKRIAPLPSSPRPYLQAIQVLETCPSMAGGSQSKRLCGLDQNPELRVQPTCASSRCRGRLWPNSRWLYGRSSVSDTMLCESGSS